MGQTRSRNGQKNISKSTGRKLRLSDNPSNSEKIFRQQEIRNKNAQITKRIRRICTQIFEGNFRVINERSNRISNAFSQGNGSIITVHSSQTS